MARNEAISNMKKLSEIDLTFNNNGKKQNYFIQFYVLKTKIKDVTIPQEEVERVDRIPLEQVFEMIRQGEISLGYNKKNKTKFESLFSEVRDYSQNKQKTEKNKCEREEIM